MIIDALISVSLVLLKAAAMLIGLGVAGHLFLIGSVITFNQDVIRRKESGLLFCYFCNTQIDPKAKAIHNQRLDDLQSLVGFECEKCHLDNYFPIPPIDLKRALFGHVLYGKQKAEYIEHGLPDRANIA